MLKFQFGRRLQQLREARNMSQEELAEAINVSPRHIRYIEQGQSAPSFTLMEQIMKLFKVKVTDLFDTSYEPLASDESS